ncbi:MAG: endolytic transglycosylase MltG [Sebaldella sp.]|nr:endolytic transglycosylase MltG [Sebaldella sp.]
MKKIIIVFSALIGIIIFLFILFFINFLAPTRNFTNKFIVVRKGDNFNKIYNDLGIKYNISDKIYLRITGNASKAKLGSYKFNGKVSKFEVINKITSGNTDEIRLTIPEGFTNKQVFERIEKLGLGKKEKLQEALNEKDFPYPHPDNNYEGYFYPETYFFYEGATEKEIVNTILGEFLKAYPPAKYPNKEEFYNKLKLASIVELEVSKKEDKPKVAGLFQKRLEIGMRLESDATLKYVLGRQAYRKELITDMSPYNSYKHTGLTPTPISNPSKETFDAVWHAEKMEDLFFFTYKGGTYFSKTHDEHLRKRRETGQLK